MFFANDYMVRIHAHLDRSRHWQISHNFMQVQRGPGYVTTVKMYSNRTKNTECLNDQNVSSIQISILYVY